MNPDTDLQVTRRDVTLVRRTLHHLTAAQKITCAVVIVITALIWWSLLKRLLTFGRSIDYSGLHALGAQTVALLQQYNPFFWWTVVVICTLLISYLLFNFVQYTRQRASQKIVSDSDLQQLLAKISPAASHVLAWAWENRRHPITVGVLQQTTAQLGANRYSLICLAKDQESLLQQHLQSKTNLDEPLHHL